MRTRIAVISVLIALIALPMMAGLFAPHQSVQFQYPAYGSFFPAVDTQDYIDSQSNIDSHSDHGTHDIFSDLQAYDSGFDTMTEANTAAGYYDYVDQVSNLHSPSDLGSHSSFAEMQDYDLAYDTLSEALYNPPNYHAYVNQTSNVDSHSDHGTHSAFNNLKAYDSTYDLMTEANTGTNTKHYINATSNIDSHSDHGTHSAFNNEKATDSTYDLLTEGNTAGANTIIGAQSGSGSSYVTPAANTMYLVVGAATSSGTVGTAVIYCRGSLATVNAKAVITDSSGNILTNGISNSLSITTTAGDKTFTFATPPSVTSGNTYWVGVVPDAALRIYYYATTGGSSKYDSTNSYASPSSPTDATSGTYLWRNFYANVTTTPNYECNLEASFTGIADWSQTNEELCIKTGTHASGSESFNVQVWNGAWNTVKTGLSWSAWNNVSVSSYLTSNTLYMLFIGATESGDTSQDTFNIDSCLLHVWTVNYELNLEAQWTAAPYSEVNEQLCIKTGTYGGTAENLNVQVWWSSAWTTVITGATASAWNNVSVSSYLTAATFTILLIGASETGDTASSNWNIDCAVLHCWSNNYAMDLEVGWTAAPYSETSEYLCIYGGTQDAESMLVDVWNGAAWTNVISDLAAGWNNVSVSSYLTGSAFEIRLCDATQSSDTTQSTWQVDGVHLHCWSVNYELDLEGQWTSASYSETNEYLCIRTGTLNAEALKVDIWYSSAWVNVIASLTASAWNNVSVASYLISATFTIRFLGGSESGDTTQSTWNVDCALLHTWSVSDPAPYNVANATCTNLDDTDNMYPRAKVYTFFCRVADDTGYSDIDHVDLNLQADWKVRYTQSGDQFTEVEHLDYTELVTGSCSYAKSGIYLNLTFALYIEWLCPDSTNYDLTQYVIDSHSGSDTDTGDQNYDVLTALAIYNPEVRDFVGTINRGPVDSDVYISCVVSWTQEPLYPSPSIIDVWVSCTDVASSPWQLNPSWYIYGKSDDVSGLDTYNFKAVKEGDGAGGASLGSNSHTYIADRMIVNDMTTDDGRINILAAGADHAQLKYEYDSAWVTDGSVIVNGLTGTYSGSNGWWNFGESKATSQKVTYNSVAAGGNDVHGISVVYQNSKSIDQIWDKQIIQSFWALDSRIDISTVGTLCATGYLEYDSHPLGSGDTVQLLTYGAMTWCATHSRFEYNRTETPVMQISYSIQVCHENTYDINQWENIGGGPFIIWDRGQVQSYTTNDTVANTNQYSRIYARLFYDYDDTPITDGSVTINGFAATYNGSAGWWWIEDTEVSPVTNTYDTVAISGNAYGITAIDQNGKSQNVTFTRVKILTTTRNDTDGRTGWGQYVKVSVSAELEILSHSLGAGDTVTLYGQAMSWNATSGKFELLVTKTTTGSYAFFVNSSLEATYGITALNLDGKAVSEIFDRALFTLTINKGWTVIGYNVTVSYSGHFEYDNDTFTGTVDSGGFGSYPTFYTAGNQSVTITAILTEPKYGVFAFSSNTAYCVWDTVIAVSGPAYFWVQYSVSSVWLIWGTSSSYKWQINGTWLAQGAVLASYCNGSTNALAGIWNSVGGFGGLAIGSFSSSWYHANVTVNVEITIAGFSYDWQIWGEVLTVDIAHTIHIINLGESVEDVWITFYYSTNFGNATLTIWDSLVSNTTPVGYCQWEGGYQLAKPVSIGAHHYVLLINGTHSGSGYADQVRNFAASDSWIFQNWTFTVNPVQLSFTDCQFSQNNESVIIGAWVWTSGTTLDFTVYEAGLGWTSGSYTGVVSGDWISLMWDKSSATATSNFTVYVTDGAYNKTFHGFYIKIAGDQWITIYGGSVNQEGDIYMDNTTIVYQNMNPLNDPATVAVIAISFLFVLSLAYIAAQRSIKKEIQKTIRRFQRT
jgi:hypothetical protein